MKRILAFLLALVFVFALIGCAKEEKVDINAKSEGTMTYAEYDAAELDSEVVIEGYVQGKQSWWQDAASLYLQDGDGAYFVYNAACSEEDYNKMTVGTKVKVTGYKGEWAGEVEVMDGSVEILDGTYTVEAMDVTKLLGTDDLVKNQNKKVSFKGMTVEPSTDANGNEVAFLYNWDGSGAEGSDSDLYFNVSVDGNTYNFVVEYYVCDADGVYGAETDVYKAVQGLKIGDKIDLEGFLYWYEGPNPHITSVTAAK